MDISPKLYSRCFYTYLRAPSNQQHILLSGIVSQCTGLRPALKSLHYICSYSHQHCQSRSLNLQDIVDTLRFLNIHPDRIHTVRAANSSRRSKCYSTWCRLVVVLGDDHCSSSLDCFAAKRKLIRPMRILAHQTTGRHLCSVPAGQQAGQAWLSAPGPSS